MMTQEDSSDRFKNTLLGGWHVFGAFGFALAQPLFDLLGRFPQFLVAHRVGRGELILLAAAISLGAPAALLTLELLLAALGERLRQAVHHLLLGLLLGILLLQVVNRLSFGLPSWVSAGLAALAAAAIVGLYANHARVRVFFNWAAAAALLFPIVFLFFSPARRLLFGAAADSPDGAEATAPATVVMVVFDELPTLSLLDPQGEIDAVRYPHLARLSRDAHWFANATTVAEGTLISLPAILDGLYPTPQNPRLPFLADHPRNLFTMLRNTHRLHIVENLTQLAPHRIENDAKEPRRAQLVRDLAILIPHLALPADWTRRLPPVTESWRGFGEAPESPAEPAEAKSEEPVRWDDFEADWSTRDQKFRDFVAGIENTGTPELHFFHSMLPHAPWRYLPDGRRYALTEPPGVRGVVGRNTRGLDVNLWTDDPWLTLQAQQRHLLQVGFVDTLVGELVDRLRATGLYENCLLVITADHGAGFQPGDSRRLITPSNLPEILWVPLFVKVPGQSEGGRIDDNVQTIDILPTIAEALAVRGSWRWDGGSALSARQRGPAKTAFSDHGTKFEFERGPDFDRLLRLRLERLGWGDWDRVYAIGEPVGLRGEFLNEATVAPGPGKLRIELDGEPFFEQVNPQSSFVPALVRGRVHGLDRLDKRLTLAVALNGRVEALTQTSPELADGEFIALLNPTRFRPGRNQVEVFMVDADGAAVRLIRSRTAILSYRLQGTKGSERLVASDRRQFPVVKDRVPGWVVGGLNETGARAFVGGWAADSTTSAPASAVVVIQDGESIAVGQPALPREDAVARLGPNARNSGFVLEFPAAALKPGVAEAQIRVFAISSAGVASELHYPPPDSDKWPFLHPASQYPKLATYDWGAKVNPGTPGSAVRLLDGWGTPEGTHVWTVDRQAEFSMLLPKSDSPLLLTLVLKAYLPNQTAKQSLRLRVGDRLLVEWTFLQDRFESRTVEIPLDLVESGGPVTFTFEFPDAVAPAQAGTSPDRRKLGVAVSSISLAAM